MPFKLTPREQRLLVYMLEKGNIKRKDAPNVGNSPFYLFMGKLTIENLITRTVLRDGTYKYVLTKKGKEIARVTKDYFHIKGDID